MWKKQFFFVLFSELFWLWAKIFSDFRRKIFKSCENYLLRVQRNNLWLEIFFKSFESFWIFCRNLWHGSQNSIYVSRVKIALETVFLFFFSDFFRILSEKSFRHSVKKLQKVVKTTFCVSTGTTCGFKFFKKFWTVLDFLQKLLAWFSKFFLRVQSKNCVRNSFRIFLFRFFSDFERKIFQTFGRKTSRLCQNYLLRLQAKNLWLDFCFKFWIVSDFLQKPLASKFYLRVQIKNCGKNSFFFVLFSELFWLWAKIFSDFRRKIFKKLSKLPSACPQEQLVALNFLKSFEPFWIFYRNFWHGSQNSIYVSRVKIALETVFLFFFSIFFRILSEKSFRLSVTKLQKVVKTTFCVSTGTTCGFKFFKKFWTVLDFLQKLLALFSKFYLRVQSKNCVRNSFLIFLFRFFSDFERNISQTFGQKTSKSCQNYFLRVHRNNLWL